MANTAKQEKQAKTREQYPHLEATLDVFRDNRFRSTDVFALVSRQETNAALPETTQKKFAALDESTQKEMTEAAQMLLEGFKLSDRKRSRAGTETKSPMERLESDMQKICNFNHATPHHRTRQDLNAYFHQIELTRDALEELGPSATERTDTQDHEKPADPIPGATPDTAQADAPKQPESEHAHPKDAIEAATAKTTANAPVETPEIAKDDTAQADIPPKPESEHTHTKKAAAGAGAAVAAAAATAKKTATEPVRTKDTAMEATAPKQPETGKTRPKAVAPSSPQPPSASARPPEQWARAPQPSAAANSSTGSAQNPEGGGKSQLRNAGIAAGVTAGIASSVAATTQWRDRVKNPDARKKAIAFASVAAVSAVAVASALFLRRGNSVSR